MKNRKKGIFFSLLVLHFLFLLLGLAILFFVPFDDKIVWNGGYVVVWMIPLTAIAVGVSKAVAIRKVWRWLKVYLIVFWSIPVVAFIGSFFMGIFGVLYLFFLGALFVPNEMIAQNNDYVIRKSPSSTMVVRPDFLYRKTGVTEKFIGELPMESSTRKSVLHLGDEVRVGSFDVNTEKGAVTIQLVVDGRDTTVVATVRNGA